MERVLRLAAVLLAASAGLAIAQVPKPHYAPTHWPIHDGVYHIHDFRFGTGETLADLRLHYVTLGKPRRDAAGHTVNAVLLIHGTSGDAHSLLDPVFSDVLFGPAQPLDINKYFIILPDLIGHGESSRPSDGLRMKFPRYTYDDMVRATHQVLTEGCTSIICASCCGTSMGCMQSFVWGEMYPKFMDALMPLACMPMEIAGRNRIWR